MLGFSNVNLNPKGKKTGDCAIRALAGASGRPYSQVYDDLYLLSKKTGYVLNDMKNVAKLLRAYGFEKLGKPFKPNGKTYEAREADSFLEPGDVAVLQVANHLTCVVGGTIRDTWDCGRKSVYGRWVLKKEGM